MRCNYGSDRLHRNAIVCGFPWLFTTSEILRYILESADINRLGA